MIDVKEVGILSMAHPVLKKLCDENCVWKVLYTRMIPPQIIDSSVHLLAEPCINIASRAGCRCMPRGLFKKIPGWHGYRQAVNLPGLPVQIHWSENYFLRLPVDQQQSIQQAREYYANHIRELWIEHNRKKKLSTQNLCQCVEHYKVDTLKFPGPKVNHKCF